METKIFCGDIIYNSTKYGVFWDTFTKYVWVNSANDPILWKDSYGEFKASNEKQALQIAPSMLESAGK